LGATGFGPLTYVGNGPNLLVKAIAEQAKVETPSFFVSALESAIPALAILVPVSTLLFGNKPRRLRFEVVLVNCPVERSADRRLCLPV
jgi:Na+/H+ antiporter NhaD/arsenite permease-like protein